MNKILIAFCLCSGHLLFGQAKSSFSLLDAQETALSNSEKLKNATFDQELARLKVMETRAIGLPQVDFNGSFSNFLNLPVQVVSASFINPDAGPDETISFKAGTDFSAAGTLQVSQLLFNGSYLVGLQVSTFYREFSNTLSEKTKEDVLFDVTQAYQMAVVAKTNVRFMDSIMQTTQNLIDKQANYLELGLMLQEDMDQLDFALTNAKNTLANANLQYDNALALLKMTMGLDQQASVEPNETVEALLLRVNSLESANQSVTNNINYLLLSKQITLNEYNLKNKKAAHLPTASAFFQQTYNAYRNEFTFFANEKWFPQTLWGLQVSIPIFSSGSRWAKIEQAQVELEKSRNQLTELNRALEMQRVQYNNNLKNAQNQLELQQKNIALAKKIYENALLKEKIGNGNSIVVTQKYNQLVLAQAQYIGAMLDVFNSKLNLDKLYHNVK